MARSWDETVNDKSHFSHAEWQNRIFMKVIHFRLHSPPTAGIEEDVRDPEHYELKSYVLQDEFDDGWE